MYYLFREVKIRIFWNVRGVLFDPSNMSTNEQSTFYRSLQCLLLSNNGKCNPCIVYDNRFHPNNQAVTSDLNDDMVNIMKDADQSKVSPFMKFFWEEQQKYLKSASKSVRYHPMVIRYCLSLASKSASAFNCTILIQVNWLVMWT